LNHVSDRRRGPARRGWAGLGASLRAFQERVAVVVGGRVVTSHGTVGPPEGAARRALRDSIELQRTARNRTPRRRRRARRARKYARVGVSVLFASMVVLLLLGLLLGLLLVLPAGDRPAQADAVVVLAGPGERIEAGEQLIRDGYADTLVIASTTPDNCRPDVPARQICFTPKPPTTRGEARFVARLADHQGWARLLVIAENGQARRARLRLARCLPDDVHVGMITVRASPLQSVRRAVHEAVAWPKALILERSC
jgi:uncharacterized SAM-binding protein YcdF (DUF218 family)